MRTYRLERMEDVFHPGGMNLAAFYYREVGIEIYMGSERR